MTDIDYVAERELQDQRRADFRQLDEIYAEYWGGQESFEKMEQAYLVFKAAHNFLHDVIKPYQLKNLIGLMTDSDKVAYQALLEIHVAVESFEADFFDRLSALRGERERDAL